MEKLNTATGKTFYCDYFNPCAATGHLNARLLNTSISSAAAVFSNPEETKLLSCGSQSAATFNRLVAIVPEGNAIRIILAKE